MLAFVMASWLVPFAFLVSTFSPVPVADETWVLLAGGTESTTVTAELNISTVTNGSSIPLRNPTGVLPKVYLQKIEGNTETDCPWSSWLTPLHDGSVTHNYYYPLSDSYWWIYPSETYKRWYKSQLSSGDELWENDLGTLTRHRVRSWYSHHSDGERWLQ